MTKIHRNTSLITIVAAVLALAGLSSCMKENFKPGGLAEGEGYLVLGFGSKQSVEVTTKSTLAYGPENRVSNLYVLIFDNSGNKVYGRWFQESEVKATEEEVTGNNVSEEGWWVSNSSSEGTLTYGVARVKAPAGSGFTVYLVSNLNSDIVRLTASELDVVTTQDELNEITASLAQHTIYRQGSFIMEGNASNVTIKSGQSNRIPTENRIQLVRLDAKVRFVFKTGTSSSGTDMTFTPEQWKVVNIPTTSNLLPAESDSHNVDPTTDTDLYGQYSPYFFESNWLNFEEELSDGSYAFSFYMLENRMVPKNASATNTYHDRGRQVKSDTSNPNYTPNVTVSVQDATGTERDMRVFENANDFSTYVLVTGQLEMDVAGQDYYDGQVLYADVQYLIHLGDWGSDTADFNTVRNTSYTYMVTINGVDKILVEVRYKEENQPGATGDVTIAKQEVITFDAHYASHTITFNIDDFLISDGTYSADMLTWRVDTPFSSGMPQDGNAGLPLEQLDYKWVLFRFNKTTDGNYRENRRKFVDRVYEPSETYRRPGDNLEGDGTNGAGGRHNDGCLDVVQLVEYIKEQVSLFSTAYNNSINEGNDADTAKKAGIAACGFDGNGNIRFTAFINEYYYEEHPLGETVDHPLWKDFVNQRDRKMHILCNAIWSHDGESSETGSVVTLQQKAIQCVYNTDTSIESLLTAWGAETIDENLQDPASAGWPYNNQGTAASRDSGNDKTFNGRYNTAREWGFSDDMSNSLSWGNFMNFEVTNDAYQLTERYLRYSCMSRNRDNNGNGTIDADEVRWYMAATKQLEGIFMGDGLLPSDAKLYNRTTAQKASSDKHVWMQHVVTSTQSGNNSNNPTVYWAEEGVSTSSMSNDMSWATSQSNNWTVRCIRNLGMDDSIIGSGDTAPQNGDDPLNFDVPQDIVQINGNVVSIEYLNPAGWRDYTSQELPFHNEMSQENKVYRSFEIHVDPDNDYAVRDSDGNTYNKFSDIKNELDNNLTNPFCPEGYRFPNQRELAIMRSYFNYYPSQSRTAWSMGRYASDFGLSRKTTEDKDGFTSLNTGIITIQNTEVGQVRCVRDIRQ